MPTTPPVRTGSNVLSIFSGAYTNQTGVAFLNFGASTINADLSLTGSPAGSSKYYTGHSYSGIQVNTAGSLDVSAMTTLHMDVWSPKFASMKVKLEGQIAGNAVEIDVPGGTTQSTWKSYDIPLSGYTGAGLTSIKYIVPVTFGQNATLYITNVYFYKPEALPLLTGNLYINDGSFVGGDYCTAVGQDIAGNDGTTGKPFLTLAYALSRSSQAAGTIFYIDAGTYSWSATHTFTASGTLANPITIQGKGNASTIITSTTSTNSGLYFSTGNYWTVKDLQWNTATAKSVWVDTAIGITLQNCIFNFTSASATLQSIFINGAGALTIKNSTLTRNNVAFHMIEIAAGASLTLQDNTISFSALALSAGVSSVRITPNASSIFILERNKFYGGGYAIDTPAATAFAANGSSIIKNNFFNTYFGIVSGSITGLKVYNNSFYTNGECLYGYGTGFLTNWDIQNNIFYNYGTDATRACVFYNSSTSHPTTLNYNYYYYPNNGANGAVKQVTTSYTLSAWKALTTTPVAIREANGIGGSAVGNNPLYVNTATQDLHLQSTSPAIGVGNSSLVTNDIDGTTRPLGGTYEIGADEVVPSLPAPTLGSFTVPAKLTSDVPFALTAPTSNSAGAFTYNSSNTAVATISGSTITIVGVGTSIITATQAANGAYGLGSTTASFVVSAPSMQAAPIPPCRASSDVFAIYNEGPYTGVPIIWGGGVSEVLIGSNKIELMTNVNNANIAFAPTAAAAAMTFLHVDIYSTTASANKVKLFLTYPTTNYYSTPNGVWTSLDIPASSLGGFASVNLVKILLDTNGTFYVDNIYFWRDPTTPTFTQVPAVCSGATMTALPTTSNNGINGTWSPALNNMATTLYTFTTSGTCPNTTTMTITVNPVINPSVSIAVSPSTTVCAGTSVTFTATPTNGGASPSYQWQVNGSNVGTNSATYTSTTLANNAAVRVVMTSNATCATVSPATSTPITMTVNATPAITITTAQPNCSSSTGTITVTPPSNELGITYTVTRTSPVVGVVTNEEGVFNGLSVGNYTVTTTNASGCISAPASSTINTFTPVINTWTAAGWSNGTPTSDQKIVFSENYNTNVASISANLIACSCQVNSGIVTIGSGNTMTLTNSLTVSGGSLTFEDSASLVQINDVPNIGDITYNRQTTRITKMDYTYWSTPVLPFTLGDVSPNTSGDKMYSFDSNIDNWKQESPATSMVPGVGYIIRGPQNFIPPFPPSTYIAPFVGVPNNGDYDIKGIVAGRSYLLGNPYPSALDADAFLDANQNVLGGTLYFWTHNTPIAIGTPNPGSGVYAYSGNDYAAYNATGGVATINPPDIDPNTGQPYPSQAPSGIPGINNYNIPTGKIASGQGFFGSSKDPLPSTPIIIFDNTMRVGVIDITKEDNSQFFKTKNPKAKTNIQLEKHRIWLDLTNSQGAFKQTLVGYVTDATNGYEDRFDGESYDGNDFLDFYSINEEKNLTIQGRAVPFDENDEIPLGYRIALGGSFTISIDETDGLLTNQAVYLEDKATNTIFNLKNGNYTFTTDKGTFNDRFVLRYTDKTLGTAAVEKPANHI